MTPFSCLERHRAWSVLSHVERSSESSGWRSLFASVQTQAKFEGSFPAIEDHLVTISLKRPIHFEGRIGEISESRLVLPGSVTFTPGGSDMSVHVSSEYRSFDTIYLHIRHDLLRETYLHMFESIDGFVLMPCVGIMDSMIFGIASEINRLLHSPEIFGEFYIETLARSLASRLICTQTLRGQRRTKSVKALPPSRFNRAIQYIETYLDDRLNLDSIAKAVGVCTETLTQDFKKNTNLTPYEYITQARVDRAKRLLTSTKFSLAEIALQCGFSDQQHMSHIVRRVAGLTPGAIRRNG